MLRFLAVACVSAAASPADGAAADATLKSLTISPGALSPAFSPEGLQYSATEPFELSCVQLLGEVGSAGATALVDGEPLGKPGAAGCNVHVPPGYGNLTKAVVVTSADRSANRSYGITLVRPPPPPSWSDASLQSLVLSSGELVPPFEPGQLLYSTARPAEETCFALMGRVNFTGAAPFPGGANAWLRVDRPGRAREPLATPGSTGCNVEDTPPFNLSVLVESKNNATARTYVVAVTPTPSCALERSKAGCEALGSCAWCVSDDATHALCFGQHHLPPAGWKCAQR